MGDSQQRVVLITGCSSGIGKALAVEFKKHNCRVFASARNVDKLGDLSAQGIDLVRLDVTNTDSMKRAVDEVIEKAGRIDVLVNNAGLTSYTPAVDVTVDESRQLFETNFFGTVILTQLVAHKYMIPNRTGTIVMVSSMMGEISTPFSSTYSATKAALTKFSDSLRMELAPFDVNVVILKPGGVKSDIVVNAKEKTEKMLSGPSTYSLILGEIQKRSQASQHHPMPTEVFAERVVAQVLKTKPPPTMLLGSNSMILWIMSKFFPHWLSDYVFSKKMGLSRLRKLLRLPQQDKKQQ